MIKRRNWKFQWEILTLQKSGNSSTVPIMINLTMWVDRDLAKNVMQKKTFFGEVRKKILIDTWLVYMKNLWCCDCSLYQYSRGSEGLGYSESPLENQVNVRTNFINLDGSIRKTTENVLMMKFWEFLEEIFKDKNKYWTFIGFKVLVGKF